MDIVTSLVLVIIVAVVAIVGLFVARAMMSGSSPVEAMSGLFGPKPERRLDVVEHASIDGRRRLILVRRDNVEHLIMTGGPVDLVIETGIEGHRPAAQPATRTSQTVSSAPGQPRS